MAISRQLVGAAGGPKASSALHVAKEEEKLGTVMAGEERAVGSPVAAAAAGEEAAKDHTSKKRRLAGTSTA